jgi:hypothetical protein
VLTEGIAVAVGAFVLVITLDVTRRENDRKVLAVKLQMQELMMVFFECVPMNSPCLLLNLSVGSATFATPRNVVATVFPLQNALHPTCKSLPKISKLALPLAMHT